VTGAASEFATLWRDRNVHIMIIIIITFPKHWRCIDSALFAGRRRQTSTWGHGRR